MSLFEQAGEFGKVMAALAAAAIFYGLLAFVPSPLRLFDIFEARPAIEIKEPGQVTTKPLPILDTFAPISQRPLFNPDRKPDPLPEQVTSGAPTPAATVALGDLTQYRLIGLVGDSQTQLALIQKSGGPISTMKPGDTFEGWMVDKIDANGVSISGGGRKEILTIPKARNNTETP